jgi:hypothetical protein
MHKLVVDALVGESKYHIYVVLYEWLLSRTDSTPQVDAVTDLAAATALSRGQVQSKLALLSHLGLVYKMPGYNTWLVHTTVPADVAPVLSALQRSEAWITKDKIFTANGQINLTSNLETRTTHARKYLSARAIKLGNNDPKLVATTIQGIYSIELLDNSTTLDENSVQSIATYIPALVHSKSRHYAEGTNRIDTTICTDTNKELSTKTNSTLCEEQVSIHSTKDSVGTDDQIPLVPTPSIIEQWFTHWQVALNRQNSRLLPKRRSLLKAALAAGITLEQGIQAIDYVASNPFFSGANDRGGDYTDITTIFRTPERVEQYARQLNLSRPLSSHVVNQKLTSTQPPKKGHKF